MPALMPTRLRIGLISVFFIALSTRVLFLGSIDQVVFDEVHFGKFISSYCCTHQRFFDIHPPIGKLLIAGGAYIAGYNGQFSFEHIGQKYENIPIAGIRIVPAFFGSLLPVVIMVLLWQAGVSFWFSLLGGIAAALENSLIVESRYILTDSILLTATFGCVAAAIAAVQTKNKTHSWLYVIVAGILAGIALGTKFTGAIGGGLVVMIFFAQAIRAGYGTWGHWIGKMILVACVAAAVYLFGWFLHFSLLTLPGSGDIWGVPTGNFWQDVVHAHWQMLSANYNLTAGHPYGSKWYTWPLMIRSVFYWQGDSSTFVYFLGNPIVWWGSASLLIGGVVSLFAALSFSRRRESTRSRRGSPIRSGMTLQYIFLLGYAASYVPLMRVPRVLFLYHYLTPLLFSLLFGIWWLEHTLQYSKKIVCICLLALIVLGFLYISPLTYGFAVPDAWQHVFFFISSWR